MECQSGQLYGLALTFMLGSSAYCAYCIAAWFWGLGKYKAMEQQALGERDLALHAAAEKRYRWTDRGAKLLAVFVALTLWWFDGKYRRDYSAQATAVKTIEQLASMVELGQAGRAVHELKSIAMSIQPWQEGYCDDSYDEPY